MIDEHIHLILVICAWRHPLAVQVWSKTRTFRPDRGLPFQVQLLMVSLKGERLRLRGYVLWGHIFESLWLHNWTLNAWVSLTAIGERWSSSNGRRVFIFGIRGILFFLSLLLIFEKYLDKRERLLLLLLRIRLEELGLSGKRMATCGGNMGLRVNLIIHVLPPLRDLLVVPLFHSWVFDSLELVLRRNN